jgi:hypothetical protein
MEIAETEENLIVTRIIPFQDRYTDRSTKGNLIGDDSNANGTFIFPSMSGKVVKYLNRFLTSIDPPTSRLA